MVVLQNFIVIPNEMPRWRLLIKSMILYANSSIDAYRDMLVSINVKPRGGLHGLRVYVVGTPQL